MQKKNNLQYENCFATLANTFVIDLPRFYYITFCLFYPEIAVLRPLFLALCSELFLVMQYQGLNPSQLQSLLLTRYTVWAFCI